MHTTRIAMPGITMAGRLIRAFSPFEKTVFYTLAGTLILSALALLASVNNSILVEVEAKGGGVTEGIVGSPRFINPLLAISDADRDLSSLVYSGLLKATPEGGLIEDLAESYAVSEDGLVYSFIIKENAEFHDGAPVTADDIVYTVMRALDPMIKSPRRASWDGVHVEKVSDREVRFILPRPYAPFLQNATLGILPKHVWENVSAEQFPFSERNVTPIGSGPYAVRKVERNSSGIPEGYTLRAFDSYALGRPYISALTLRFYPNEDMLIAAYIRGDIEALNSISPEKVARLHAPRVEQSPLSRIFAVFFNQNIAQIFSHREVREALSVAIDREQIITDVLADYGTAITGPIPPGSISTGHSGSAEDGMTAEDRIAEGRNILERNGWKFNEEEGVWIHPKKGRLEFSLATSNVPELKATAEIAKATWEKLGARVDVKIFESGNLNQNSIRPREYDALLFGEIVGRELDLFAFWHSSQRNDPGLNIALYANITADKLLEKGRKLIDPEERDAAYAQFEDEVAKDIPAVFLYAPDFIYVLPEKIQGASLGSITTSSDRYLTVHHWYIKTDKVWGIFSR